VVFRRILYFRTPLEQGHGGRHRVVRVTEHGSTPRCGARLHDLEIDVFGYIFIGNVGAGT
jgi:hypothetical protein